MFITVKQANPANCRAISLVVYLLFTFETLILFSIYWETIQDISIIFHFSLKSTKYAGTVTQLFYKLSFVCEIIGKNKQKHNMQL